MDILYYFEEGRAPLGFGNRHTDKSMEVRRRTCLDKNRGEDFGFDWILRRIEYFVES